MIQNSAYDILMKSAGSEHLKHLGESFRFPDSYRSQKSSMIDGANNNHEYQNVQDKKDEE